MQKRLHTGRVILAGAGPGDEDLITLRLQKALQQADVIITDRLVNPAIIEQNSHPGVRVIRAGKQGYNKDSVSQADINRLLLRFAHEGLQVLRLKGGDLAFFSNLLDELETLRAHDIPYELIPGITAASGASAFAAIPLTARGHAQGVQFHSFHPSAEIPESRWHCLAASGDTLVFYMAMRQLPLICENLLRHLGERDLPLAVIEQACTPYQRVHTSSIRNALRDFSGMAFSSPSLLVIGEVVKLHEAYQWYSSLPASGSLFHELAHT